MKKEWMRNDSGLRVVIATSAASDHVAEQIAKLARQTVNSVAHLWVSVVPGQLFFYGPEGEQVFQTVVATVRTVDQHGSSMGGCGYRELAEAIMASKDFQALVVDGLEVHVCRLQGKKE